MHSVRICCSDVCWWTLIHSCSRMWWHCSGCAINIFIEVHCIPLPSRTYSLKKNTSWRKINVYANWTMVCGLRTLRNVTWTCGKTVYMKLKLSRNMERIIMRLFKKKLGHLSIYSELIFWNSNCILCFVFAVQCWVVSVVYTPPAG
jgi:hypothetical protein